MSSQLRRVLLSGSLVSLGLLGCGEQPNGSDQNSGIEQLYGGLEGDPGYGYWNTSPWDASPVNIRVCWENPTDADATFRSWSQDAVERTWQRYARVNFNYWGTCDPNTVEPGIHIIMETTSNSRIVPWIGPDGNAHVGMYALNQRRASLNPAAGMWLNSSVSEATARNWAAHEFGHALGFWHEESRPDAPGAAGQDAYLNGGPADPSQCGNPDSIASAAGELGTYNTDSIMSYCGGQAGGLQRLSATDIASVQRIYGRRILGQIVSPRGYCMAANSWTTGETGVEPFLWTCDEYADDQEWKWLWQNNAISFNTYLSSDPTHPAAITMLSATAGTFLEMRDLGTSTYEWTFSNVEIRGYGAKCLTYQGLGNAVTMNDCSSRDGTPTRNANQRWDRVDPNGMLRVNGTNTCLAVPNQNNPLVGQLLITATCNANDSSQWFFFGDNGSQLGNLEFPRSAPTTCFDVQGPNDQQFTTGQGGPVEGAYVQLYTCTTGMNMNMNQQWNLTGQIQALGNCMDREWGGDGLNQRMWTWGCTSAANGDFVSNSAGQEWDVYWK